MLEIERYAKKTESLITKTAKTFHDAGLKFPYSSNNADTIKLVFAGQYSAGKSSILKMLTGRTDIAIGAGITTQEAHTYDWNGMKVVDTPGIATEKRPDHDEISYAEIASADMLVFVITNELFDSHLAEHFRKLAIEKDKAGEMILVVNKMQRCSEGNSEYQQSIITEDLKKVLAPYSPEQLNLCFLDAESYLESLAETDDEIIDELVERSGYSKFIETLNHFVSSKSLSSKLTTGLYILDDIIEKEIEQLSPRSSDTDIDALEENYLQQRHVLTDSRTRLEQEIKDIFSIAGSKIREIGLDSAHLISEGCKKDVVESELEKQIDKANDITEACQNKAVNVLETRLKEIGKAIDRIEESDFTVELKSRLVGKFDGLPDNVKKILAGAGKGLTEAEKLISRNAYKAGVSGGLKLSNFSGSTLHSIVLKAGQSIGYKFKPWQAVKITKGITVAGKVLGVLGVGLSVFMQIKEDSDEEKMRETLRDNRQNIRSQFNAAAKDLEDFGYSFIQENVVKSLSGPIAEIDSNIQEIRDSRTNKSIICRNLENLHIECQNLIQEIHNNI